MGRDNDDETLGCDENGVVQTPQNGLKENLGTQKTQNHRTLSGSSQHSLREPLLDDSVGSRRWVKRVDTRLSLPAAIESQPSTTLCVRTC